MSRIAPRVHTDAPTIARLKELQLAMDAELVAELHLHEGRVVTGTIAERPTLQTFLDEQGNEGANGFIRLDTGDGGVHLLWLDEVEHFVRVGTR